VEHKAARRHTPTKDRMSFKRRRDQWPGMPFPVSGQRRVTRRSRVTRTRNFSRKAARERERERERDREQVLSKERAKHGMDEAQRTSRRRKKKRGDDRVYVVVLSLSLSLSLVHARRVISNRSISRAVPLHVGMSRTDIGHVTSARLLVLGHHVKSRDTITYRNIFRDSKSR